VVLEKYKIGTLLDADKKIVTKSQGGASLSLIISCVCILSILGFTTVWMLK